MRKPIIAGNWKMHKTVEEAVALVREMRAALDAIETVESVVCPPFIAIPAVAEALRGSRVGVGAQNMFWAKEGAYTGEIAPGMLQGWCQYVILGHSERRQYFGETDEGVNKKVHAALAHGLTPIICVGENLEENRAGQTDAVVRRQVVAALAGLTAAQVASLVIAYEPVWAIGTGLNAEPADANRVIGLIIRGAIAELYDEATAQAVRVQYGGSTNPANIGAFMQMPDIDGALVGGASLKAANFVEMVRIAAQVRG
ncbi:MAG: triose-phosphate isomerase [Caldilineales bacterium]|nr:triose-phosphate isomerase [Caldilineales bacterium]MDW8316334.1 triose-phosphate isomerase [Anaerolineae bacterium]